MTTSPTTLRRFTLLVGLLLAVTPGCHKPAAPEEDEHHKAPVQAEPAKSMPLAEWTDLLGTTIPLPNHSARVSAAVEGHVRSVFGNGTGEPVVEGQKVKKGDVIVQMDDRVPRANLTKLQATLRDLEEQYKQAEYAVELATIDVNRFKELLNGSSGGRLPLVSRVELEKSQVLQKDARSKLKSVKAKKDAAVADQKAIEEQLEFFTLRAPIAGRLSIVHAVPGQTLSPGTIVADVVDLNQIDVLCYAPPDTAAKLRLGLPAKLLVEEASAAPSKEALEGKVAFIAVQAQPETGNIAVKVRFPNAGHQLRANAVVRVLIQTSPMKERLTIPEKAVMEDEDVPTVVVVEHLETEKEGKEEHKVGKARNLQVELGVRDRENRMVEILSLKDPETKKPVSPKDLLFVTSGGQGLENGDRVVLEEEEKKEEGKDEKHEKHEKDEKKDKDEKKKDEK